VQDEWVNIRTKFGHEEWHPMHHKATNEVNIARETVELVRTPRSCALFTQSDASTLSPFSADCIISMFGFDLR